MKSNEFNPSDLYGGLPPEGQEGADALKFDLIGTIDRFDRRVLGLGGNVLNLVDTKDITE